MTQSSTGMRRWVLVGALVVGVATSVAAAPPTAAQAAPYCGIYWGSLPKTAGAMSVAPIINVRAGQHACYDRLVVDLAGPGGGTHVQYVAAVRTQAKGDVLPLRGGAFLRIVVLDPTHNVDTGVLTYRPANRTELVNVTGWRTFRQIAYGGSDEGYTTIGLGVRAHLPFRVFTLPGPGAHSRLVIDVAHRW
jgi:hypothetical protein